MPRRLRKDYPGAWHHLVDRGIARRTVFESREDIRYFLACLAREVRAGTIEVHSYSILTTHFHLLVRSPCGRLSSAMQRILNAYTRWFNMRRRRDGPLFRGRFVNRLVESDAYWWAVVRYIDRNPVQAGLCTHPVQYPHGSAWHYGRRKGPPWLRRDLVEVELGNGKGEWDPRTYFRFAAEDSDAGQAWLVQRLLRPTPPPGREDPLDSLLGAAPAEVREWMDRKALLADGTVTGWLLASPETVQAQFQERRGRDPGRELHVGPKSWPWWEVAEAGALRGWCGLTHREISERTGQSGSTVRERLRMHSLAMRRVENYSREAAEGLAEVLSIDHGGRRRGGIVLQSRTGALPPASTASIP